MTKFYAHFSKNLKSILSLTVFILLVNFADAQLGVNLIVNGDAETFPVIGNGWIAGRNDLGGNWYLMNGDPYPTVGHGSHGGSYFFSAGNQLNGGATSEISQVIQLVPIGLDNKDLSFNFSGYVSTNGNFDGGNIVMVKIEYLNNTADVVNTYSSNFIPTSLTDYAWFNLTDTYNVLAANGIASIKVTLHAENQNTVAPIEAYYDDLSLVATLPLPISLLDFAAVQGPDNKVALSWQTALEQNSHYTEIQRSGDGRDFGAIGQVPAAGNSKLVKDYSFMDGSPLNGNGFYRLRLVDLDGSYKYSKIVTVRSSASGKMLEVLNNPFYDQIGVKLSAGAPDQLILTLTDMSGRVYLRQPYRAQAGNNFINIYPSPGIARGLYLLNVKGANMNQTITILKQ